MTGHFQTNGLLERAADACDEAWRLRRAATAILERLPQPEAERGKKRPLRRGAIINQGA